jgi:cardiolipin synthase
MKITLSLWLFALLILALVAMIVILWSVKRRRRPHLAITAEAGLDDLVPAIVGVTQGTMAEGNRVTLLQNGAFWDSLFLDIARAQESIHFETFLSKEGALTRRMSEALCDKAKQGVEVRVMLDGSGGKNFGKQGLADMCDAGVQLHKYHPFTIRNLGILNNRDHRKLAIIDGCIGYVGGHCLVDSWLGDAEDRDHFRDISARVEGPVVAQIQSAFSENWIEECGEVPAGKHVFPKLEPVGAMQAHVVWTSPSGSPSTLKLLHYMAIHAAKKNITIQNPYFLPDPDARDSLVAAAKRGVTVRIMIPATEASDSPLVQHASHHHYGTLLKGGVQLFDYGKTLLHQKVMVIDGCWAAVGSTNFDDRSFEVNDEVSLVIYDEAIARELEETFERDLAHAKEVHLEPWKHRPWSHKITDFSAFLFNEQL